MSIEIPFKRLSDADELLPFDCGDEDLNNYLFSDALSYQNQLLSVTYYLDNGDETILFFSLSNDKIAAIELTNGFWRKNQDTLPTLQAQEGLSCCKNRPIGSEREIPASGEKLGSIYLELRQAMDGD